MTTIVQKADLAGLDFTNNNTNAAGGIGVNVSPTSAVGTAITAANVFLQTGTGAVARTLLAKAQDIVAVQDYASLAQMWASATYKPKMDTATGKVWLNTDPTPLDYSTSRAGFVFQHRDAASGSSGQEVPGAVFQFNSTGDGVVSAGSEVSSTTWHGVYGYQNKTGDGSAHSFTCTGQLGAVGAGGYNELGGFQGNLTNLGSSLGTMSGVELLLKDSPDGGTTTYSTKMQAIVGRIAKYNPTTRKSYHFYASSEGALSTNGVLGINPAGNKFQRGFDFQGAAFSSGQFGLAPNNTSLAWMDAGGSAQPIVGVSNTNVTYLRPAAGSATLDLQDYGGTTRFQVVAATGVVGWLNATLSASASAGVNGVAPLQVSGYISINVNGSPAKLAYYNP
jgi:hypothetical protein